MKHKALLLAVIFSLTLMSCSPYYSYLRADLTKENWMASVDTNPRLWQREADRWFLTGDPNITEMANRRAGISGGMSTTMVNVERMTKISANGNFQLQIFGTSGHNSAYIYGPNENVRNIDVRMNGDTLAITQINPQPNMDRVIVRIGVNQLTSLTQLGTGSIEGIGLNSSNPLTIISKNTGCIYLSGNINLRSVVNTGGGMVTVIGAKTPCLDIVSNGPSCINICGKVGVRSIIHYGTGDINIIGADSALLTIFATGSGKIGVLGIVNLRDVRASGNTAVFVSGVGSDRLTVYLSDCAYLGLSGRAANLSLEAKDSSNFLGRNFCALDAYITTKGKAHVNINAKNRIFASAREGSSIYLFGRTNMISQFVKDNAAIITLAVAERSTCCR